MSDENFPHWLYYQLYKQPDQQGQCFLIKLQNETIMHEVGWIVDVAKGHLRSVVVQCCMAFWFFLETAVFIEMNNATSIVQNTYNIVYLLKVHTKQSLMLNSKCK